MNCDIAFYTDDKNYECHKCMPKIEYIYYKIFYTYEKRPLFFFMIVYFSFLMINIGRDEVVCCFKITVFGYIGTSLCRITY